MKRNIHVFNNGVKVYDDHLIKIQRKRYNQHNIHEIEEEEIFVEILNAIPADGCFVNIGSAIGYYPLLAKRLIPGLTIHAVEPLERHREFFNENIALNGLNQSDFIIHTEGISSMEGNAEFLDRGYGSSIQRELKKKQSQSIKSAVRSIFKTLVISSILKRHYAIQTIKTITLDNLYVKVGKLIDLCQIDVQGLEFEVLKGGQNTMQTGSVNTFLIGTHSQKLHKDCIDLLTKNGYVIKYDNYYTEEQPDGILVASKGVQGFSSTKKKYYR
jgi:FkbM family methyltransferase